MTFSRLSRLGSLFLLVAAIPFSAGGAGHKAGVTAKKTSAAKKPTLLPSHKIAAAKPAPSLKVPSVPKTALGPPPATLAKDSTYQNADLVVDYSSNWQGYLEPCG